MANMAVLDKLKKQDKYTITTNHVNHWKNLQGTDKAAFAWQLKLDKDANFMSVTECHAQANTTNNTILQGWLTEAQVAAQENLSPMDIL